MPHLALRMGSISVVKGGFTMDYFIIVVTTAAGLYFHWWLFRRIR